MGNDDREVLCMNKISVTAYAGYKGEETPKAFSLEGERIHVVEILERWIEEGIHSGQRKRYFKVKGSDGNMYVISYDEKRMKWFMM